MSTNYLVYSPCVYNRPDDNWLLDVELYSEEFRADLISIWMDEMGLISNPAMRKQVKNYRVYFNAKERRLKVSMQNKVPETPAQLHMAVMAAICGLKDAQPNMILRSVFQEGLDLNNNTVYQDFVKYHADAAFWAMVRQGCGFVEEEPDLGQLAIHLLLTAATRTMRQEYLAGLDSFISIPHQAYCYDFISEWLHSDNITQLYDVARYVEDEARLYQRFEKLTVEDLVGTECFPCINEVILTKLMTEISDHQVYFTDEDGKQISDIQKIIADKTSDNGAERTFRCQFNLKSLKYSNTATYYLVIADEQGLQMPQREPFQIDIAFAVDEFDFFN